MREMGPSFVTVAAQGFYRSRVRNCYSLPNPEVFTGKDFGIFYSRKSLALILGGAVPAGENSILYRVGHLAEESDGSAKINM